MTHKFIECKLWSDHHNLTTDTSSSVNFKSRPSLLQVICYSTSTAAARCRCTRLPHSISPSSSTRSSWWPSSTRSTLARFTDRGTSSTDSTAIRSSSAYGSEPSSHRF